MKISIKPLSPDLLHDYLSLFDNMIFTENPDWQKCYCYSFHFTGPDETWKKENNREAVSKLISKNELHGYLAFEGDTPVGWCNANKRKNYQRLKQTYEILDEDQENVLSVVCFLIHTDFRKKGIARLLLERVIKDYSGSKYQFIEAYPAKGSSSCEYNYKGPLSLYEKFDFKIIKEFENYSIVRKKLK
jgi:ribosomal protein S18 acetylase RimI-like enzyme